MTGPEGPAGRDHTDFLYPFIEGDEHDAPSLLADLAASANGKATESRALQVATLDLEAERLAAVVDAMAARFAAGARLFTFGNGGSATDALTMAALFTSPPFGTPLPARSLVEDQAVVTALANDVGFDLVFSRQLIAYGDPGDIALGISTSGNSRNVLQAFVEAKARGLLTVGLAGYDGGEMAASHALDHCLVVRSDSVHRTQETQAVLAFEVWNGVQRALENTGAKADG
jgi:D-sedoheptulose 7-phosphate isomerase